ncbi:hypothetical protein CL622_07445 [archaeon]|nr:hypothetical protein [archaeon]
MNNPLKIGTIAYAAHTGLGILAKSFYDNNIITDVLLCPHQAQGVVSNFYPKKSLIIDTPFDPPQIRTFDNINNSFIKNKDQFLTFCENIDVLFLFETSFWTGAWYLLKQMKNRPKIILMPMYESTPLFWNKVLDIFPDLLLCPSKLDYNFYKHHKWQDFGAKMECINVPVEVPWKKRERALHFIHNAGNDSYNDRNGTALLIEAIPLIKSPIKLTINTQNNTKYKDLVNDVRVTVNTGTRNYEDLWVDGDVFVFPENLNALSLPLQEARAAGMYIIAGDRFPINKWLPIEGLIPVKEYKNINLGQGNIAYAKYTPHDLAKKIDNIYNTDISQYSLDGLTYAQENSWESLYPKYINYIKSIL